MGKRIRRGSRHQLRAGVILMAITTTAAPARPQTAFDQYELDNGLTVILQEDHSAPVVSVVVMYHVGSKNERPDRTGFAHLFEHMMFQGSEHVGDNEHFSLLQEVGARINGTTNSDRTNYFETVPRNYLELALYLESDRMGFLLPAMTKQKLDNQRDVVKNERRQSYENRPYGTAGETLDATLYPPDHPYHWPVIGYMKDLTAATLEDVTGFFRVYYAPNNAVLVIAGDFEPAQTRAWIAKYFGSIPRGTAIDRPHPRPVSLPEERRIVLEDRVHLPRLYVAWPSAPLNSRDDAVLDLLTDIMSIGKNSRLYKSLVYEQQIAQNAVAYQNGAEVAGDLGLQVTAKPGHSLTEMEEAVEQELARLLADGVTEKEIQTALNAKEVSLINARATTFGRANALATYFTLTGDAANINREFDRFRDITPEEVLAVARKYFTGRRVVLSVVPVGKTELAAQRTNLQRKDPVE